MVMTGSLPTDRQLAFLDSLAEQKVQGGKAELDKVTAVLRDEGRFDRSAVSKLIDALVNAPDVNRPGVLTSDGFFEKDGTIYKVQWNRAKTSLYAKRLVPPSPGAEKGDFVYEGTKPLRFLTEADRLTLDRAKELGHLYGMCCVCGATLTRESSIEAGIGPICAGRFA